VEGAWSWEEESTVIYHALCASAVLPGACGTVLGPLLCSTVPV